MEIAEFSGPVLEAGDDDFESARKIWNGDIQASQPSSPGLTAV
jgi:hypothetical protein